MFSYLSESAQIYADLKAERDQAYADQWAIDSVEGKEHLERKIREAIDRLEEIQQEVTETVVDRIDTITNDIAEGLSNLADRISPDEPVVLLNTSTHPKAKPSNNDHYYAYAAIASVGVVAAAALVLYGKKEEK